MSIQLRSIVSILGMITFLVAGFTISSQAEEIPYFKSEVEGGELPSVAERLPEEPYIVDFDSEEKEPGKYGGDIRLLMAKAKDIGQITVYTYARIIGFGPDFELKPDLANSVEVSEGREFTFTLRKGHKWSDGHPFTSEDFRYFWEDMVNHEDLGRRGIPTDMLVYGEGPTFEVIDEQTFKYTWKSPNPAFLPALAGPSPLYIYRPAHYMKQFHASYADKEELDRIVEEAGAQDWMALHTRNQRQRRPENPDLPSLQAWINTTSPPSTRYIFVRNPYYHRADPQGRQLPYIDRLIMSVASKDVIPAKTGSGESDLQARYLRFDNYPFLKEGEERNGYHAYLWSVGKGSQIALFPNLNTNDPVLRGLMRDVRFRRGLSVAIDREEINQVIYFGLGTPSANTMMPQSPLYRDEYADAWTEYDLDLANELLDEAGLGARDEDGIRLLPNGERAEITIESAGESTEETDVLELISDHLERAGLKVFVRSSQRDIFRRRAYSGETVMSVFTGMDNSIATANMSPQELAPTGQPQLQWPMWGQYFETNGKAGEPADMEKAREQLDLYNSWLSANSREEREEVWHAMLKNYTSQVFTIGTVNNTRQPVVVSKKLRNIPEEGIYTWEPTAYFGIYRPDTFWFDE